MKKLSALLLALTALFIFALTGCSDESEFTEKFYSSGESQIESVAVEVEDRELEISASEDNRVYIDYSDSEKEFLDISLSENNRLNVKLSYSKSWTDFIGTKPSEKYRKIKIRLPDNLLTAFSASTTNEDIKITALSVKNRINLSANGGNILCEKIGVGKAISLSAKNGNITGSLIGGWDDFSISCKIKKGDSNLPALKESGEKYFYADCNNGDINIEFIKLNIFPF